MTHILRLTETQVSWELADNIKYKLDTADPFWICRFVTNNLFNISKQSWENHLMCVCVCVCVCVRVYVVYEDTNLYNDMGMTEVLQFEGVL